MSGAHMASGCQETDKKVIVLVIILLLLCLLGAIANGFIIAVLGMKWWLRRTLSPYYKLLASLALSRFCLQWVVIGKSIYTFQHLTVFSYNPTTQLTNFLWDFLNAATIWFCTWLGLFYCMKIANLTHPVFLWLKYKVPAWIPWMQVGAVGFSGLNSILCLIGNQIIYQDYVRSDWQFGNATEYIPRNSFEKFYFFSLNLIMWTIPSALFLLFMVLVLTSLGRHMKKSLLNTPGFQDSQIQAPTRSLLALFSFVVLFTSCFLSLVLSSANSFPPQKLWYWVWQAVIHLCIGIHTTILLFINPSLRETLERGCSLRCGSP